MERDDVGGREELVEGIAVLGGEVGCGGDRVPVVVLDLHSEGEYSAGERLGRSAGERGRGKGRGEGGGGRGAGGRGGREGRRFAERITYRTDASHSNDTEDLSFRVMRQGKVLQPDTWCMTLISGP